MAAFAGTPTGVAITDADGTVVCVNPAFTALSGLEADEVVGEVLAVLRSGAGDEDLRAQLWRTVLAGGRWEGEVVERHRDGHDHTVRQTIIPVLDRDGRVTHLVAVQEDLTRLRESQARFRALFDHALDSIMLFDADGRCVEANPAIEQLTGHGPEELRSTDFSRLVAEQDRERFWEAWSRFLATGRMRGGLRLQHRDGHLVEIDFQAVTDVIEGLHLVIARDVTAEREAQRAQRFQSEALAAVGEAVVVTDAAGTIRYFNAAAESLYGWRADEVLGRLLQDVAGTDPPYPHGREVLSVLRRGQTWSDERIVRDRSGRSFPVWITSTPLFDSAGRLSSIIGVSRDISDLRVAQEQVRRRARQQQVVASLGIEVLDARDLDSVLQRICKVVAEVLDTELVKVLELSEDAADLWLRAGVGWHGGQLGTARVPNDPGSQGGYTLERDQPVIVTDVTEEFRFASPDLLRDHGVASGMSVAIPLQERTYGVLGVHSRRPRAFTKDDATFLLGVAHLIGAAVDRHAATVELERLALTDRLTGLANRALLLDRLGRVVAGAGARGAAVLLVDLEGLKLVNDALGRSAGDDLLVEVASRLAADGQTVARVGDDEFVVVHEWDQADEAVLASRAVEHGRRLHALLADHYRLGDHEVFVDVTVGVALSTPGDDAQSLLRKAEAAARHARRRPTTPVMLYEPGVGSRASSRLSLANELRHAVGQDEFLVHYQPEVDLRSGTLFGVEALVRWGHPRRGVLAPAGFLETAEGVGLLPRIGERVLLRACRDVACFDWGGDATPALAVNVSADQLVEPGFVDLVRHALDESGLAADRLYLEITENAMIEDHDGTLRSLQALRRLGARIALDDFGTGYSSLTHLHRFPIDLLKIDRAFVDAITHGERARDIVEATIALAHTLDLGCIAEGVETPQHRHLLNILGCDIGQGYLWSRPQPFAALTSWLAAGDGLVPADGGPSPEPS
jgi:diguanylate cyclase (GGDEF)-like protein/PAS domain S-box-containing protein